MLNEASVSNHSVQLISVVVATETGGAGHALVHGVDHHVTGGAGVAVVVATDHPAVATVADNQERI